MLSRWRQAKEGSGQVALIFGEPGIGKSRLVLSLRERLHDEPKATVAMPVRHITSTALFFRSLQLERSAGFLPDDPAEARLSKLQSLLRETVAEPAMRWHSLPVCLAFRSVHGVGLTRCRRAKEVAALPDISRATREARGPRSRTHGAGRCALARSDIA